MKFLPQMINGGFGSLKELNFKRLIFDEKNKVLCIIPARGGSKGIKLKNLQKIDETINFYAINAVQRSKVIDGHIRFNRGNKIAKKNMELKFSFLRKKKFSGGFSFNQKHCKML